MLLSAWALVAFILVIVGTIFLSKNNTLDSNIIDVIIAAVSVVLIVLMGLILVRMF